MKRHVATVWIRYVAATALALVAAFTSGCGDANRTSVTADQDQVTTPSTARFELRFQFEDRAASTVLSGVVSRTNTDSEVTTRRIAAAPNDPAVKSLTVDGQTFVGVSRDGAEPSRWVVFEVPEAVEEPERPVRFDPWSVLELAEAGTKSPSQREATVRGVLTERHSFELPAGSPLLATVRMMAGWSAAGEIDLDASGRLRRLQLRSTANVDDLASDSRLNAIEAEFEFWDFGVELNLSVPDPRTVIPSSDPRADDVLDEAQSVVSN